MGGLQEWKYHDDVGFLLKLNILSSYRGMIFPFTYGFNSFLGIHRFVVFIDRNL